MARSSWLQNQIALVGKTLETIEQLTALNNPDADAKANHLTMVAMPGIIKSIRDRTVGPARDIVIDTLEAEITTRLASIAEANGMVIDAKTVAEDDIETDMKKWML